MAAAQVTCGQKKTVLRVIPCERCGNDNEEDFTFHEGTGDLSDCVACKQCGKKSLQLYYNDEASEIEDLKTKESEACIDDNDIDRHQAESIGSSSQNYKDEMNKGTEKQSMSEQPVLKCLKCDATGKQQLIQMFDSDGCLAWWKCIACNEEYNKNGPLEPGASELKLKPCSSCQADDPNHFIIQECKESKDIVLVCGQCEVIHQTLVEARHHRALNLECKCQNKEKDLFDIKSDEYGNILIITCFVCDRKQDLSNESPITCTKCDNRDPSRFQLIDNDLGETIANVCQCCKSEQIANGIIKLRCGPVDQDKVKVTSPDQLKIGDHIAYHREVGYWHHAIVVALDGLLNRLKLIEYTKTEKDKEGQILEHWIPAIDWVKDAVYCIQYEIGDCLEPQVVIQRARQKMEAKAYNWITNNCENLAVWAKTGLEKKVSMNVVTCIAIVGIKVFQAGFNIYEAHKEMKAKEKCISESELTEEQTNAEMHKVKHELHEKAVAEVAKGGWQGALSAAGFIAGNLFIPVPGFGGFIGLTLASIIGWATQDIVAKKSVDMFNAIAK